MTEAAVGAINDEVLASLLEPDAVPMETLHKRYGALLELVRILIGVVPNCDRYLEIWPPAFRTYNLIVPNFLNLPFSIFGAGGAPKEIVGLGMYVASRAAECPYCSAHTCSFALRRGARPDAVAQALANGVDLSDKELATITLARSLAKVPCELSDAERNTLQQHFSDAEAQWIVLGIAMMGFLNKFMDAVGVQLETSTVAETRAVMGSDWTPGKAGQALEHENTTLLPSKDSLRTRLSVIRHAPAALKLDKQWLKGVPDQWPAVGDFLRQKTGFDFPILSMLKHKRAIRTIAAVLVENLSESQSIIGLNIKIQAGIIFSVIIENNALLDTVESLHANAELTAAERQVLRDFSINTAELPVNMPTEKKAILHLARAASPSPAIITEDIVKLCKEARLTSDGIVELVTWLSLLQMLHRLSSFVDPQPDP